MQKLYRPVVYTTRRNFIVHEKLATRKRGRKWSPAAIQFNSTPLLLLLYCHNAKLLVVYILQYINDQTCDKLFDFLHTALHTQPMILRHGSRTTTEEWNRTADAAIAGGGCNDFRARRKAHR